MRDSDPDNAVRCQQCQRIMGREVVVGALVLLLTDTAYVRYLDCICSRCQHPFYWSVGEQMLARLVNDALGVRAK